MILRNTQYYNTSNSYNKTHSNCYNTECITNMKKSKSFEIALLQFLHVYVYTNENDINDNISHI